LILLFYLIFILHTRTPKFVILRVCRGRPNKGEKCRKWNCECGALDLLCPRKAKQRAELIQKVFGILTLAEKRLCISSFLNSEAGVEQMRKSHFSYLFNSFQKKWGYALEVVSKVQNFNFEAFETTT
jgi:hypothetical protein